MQWLFQPGRIAIGYHLQVEIMLILTKTEGRGSRVGKYSMRILRLHALQLWVSQR